MLETKERDTSKAQPRPRDGEAGSAVPLEDGGRPEIVIVVGLVAVVSMVFGFVIGLLF